MLIHPSYLFSLQVLMYHTFGNHICSVQACRQNKLQVLFFKVILGKVVAGDGVWPEDTDCLVCHAQCVQGGR